MTNTDKHFCLKTRTKSKTAAKINAGNFANWVQCILLFYSLWKFPIRDKVKRHFCYLAHLHHSYLLDCHYSFPVSCIGTAVFPLLLSLCAVHIFLLLFELWWAVVGPVPLFCWGCVPSSHFLHCFLVKQLSKGFWQMQKKQKIEPVLKTSMMEEHFRVVCNLEWHSVRLYLFFDVQHFQTKQTDWVQSLLVSSEN